MPSSDAVALAPLAFLLDRGSKKFSTDLNQTILWLCKYMEVNIPCKCIYAGLQNRFSEWTENERSVLVPKHCHNYHSKPESCHGLWFLRTKPVIQDLVIWWGAKMASITMQFLVDLPRSATFSSTSNTFISMGSQISPGRSPNALILEAWIYNTQLTGNECISGIIGRCIN